MTAKTPLNEAARLDCLRHYQILDTASEQNFDDITHLAAQLCGTPAAAITLLDGNRQWLKSRIGIDVAETNREDSFCAHTILGDELVYVPDTTQDERFADNPLVTGKPFVRFYAGMPLLSPEGYAVGALCVVDTVTRELEPAQREALVRLARQVMVILEARPTCSDGTAPTRRERHRLDVQRLTGTAEAAHRDVEQISVSEARYRRLFESAKDGILILDSATGKIEDVNPYLCQLLGFEANHFLGKQLWQIGAFHDATANLEAFKVLQDKEYIRYDNLPLQTHKGRSIYVEFVSNVYVSGAKKVIQCNIRDITERKAAEDALLKLRDDLEGRVEARTADLARANADRRARASQQEAVAELGQLALTDVGTDMIFQGATTLVVSTLGVDISTVLELNPDADSLRIRANVGWEKYETGPGIPVNSSSQAGYSLLSNTPTIVVDLASETRFTPSPILIGRGVVSSITVIVAGQGRPFGTLGAMTLSQREFTVDDIHFLTTVANILAAAVERKRIANSVHELNGRLIKINEQLRTENLAKQMALDALSEVTVGLKSAKEDAEAARESADLANLSKSEFLSRMSHELRTPLNAILGFGQILEEESLPSLAMESVKYIVKGGRHLLGLINEVLDIARVEAGNTEFSIEAVGIAEVVAEVCALLSSLAAERNIRVLNCVESTEIHALADHQRLKQVLINLVANAIKYNRDGGQVEIRCLESPEARTLISIRDTGPGIAPADLDKLFTPFERLGAARSDVEGTGLGLVLSQRLVSAMDGHLSVESTVGSGSTFTVDLPHAGAALPLLCLPEGKLDHLEPASHEPIYTVLCIEDNPSNLRLLEVIFTRRPQVRLLAAIQGSIGVELARTHQPDLILLDLHLPDLHGHVVLSQLQNSPLTHAIPVLIISADATQNQIDRLLNAGAKAYLTKPLNVVEVLRTVDEFLPMLRLEPVSAVEAKFTA